MRPVGEGQRMFRVFPKTHPNLGGQSSQASGFRLCLTESRCLFYVKEVYVINVYVRQNPDVYVINVYVINVYVINIYVINA